MREKPYIKNQKDPGGSKWLCAQDEEDFAQEKLIKEWLEREGRTKQFEFKHINRKGTARNTIDTRSVRLDQKVSDDPDAGTYADFIAGSDGRDLECAGGGDEPQPDAREKISWYLFNLKITGELATWVTKILKLSTTASDERFETSATDSEW